MRDRARERSGLSRTLRHHRREGVHCRWQHRLQPFTTNVAPLARVIGQDMCGQAAGGDAPGQSPPRGGDGQNCDRRPRCFPDPLGAATLHQCNNFLDVRPEDLVKRR